MNSSVIVILILVVIWLVWESVRIICDTIVACSVFKNASFGNAIRRNMVLKPSNRYIGWTKKKETTDSEEQPNTGKPREIDPREPDMDE